MTYGDSFPEGTCLIAAHCVVLCANQRQAMVYGLGRLRPPALHPTGLCESQFHLWPEDSQNLRRERTGPHRPSTLIGTSRCNPAQLEQRFQRDKAKGKVSEVNRDPALCVSPDPLPQGRLRGMRRAKKKRFYIIARMSDCCQKKMVGDARCGLQNVHWAEAEILGGLHGLFQ
jgi:hypothetical protein